MDLFGDLDRVRIKVPADDFPVRSVSKNRIYRRSNDEFCYEFRLANAGQSGLYSLSSDLPAPFELIYLKKARSRASVADGCLVLRLPDGVEVSALNEDVPLQWAVSPASIEQTPDEVARAWNSLFRFKREDPDERIKGLRGPQLGAIHAISAYLLSGSNLDVATVVMPTGTGKTETMVASLLYHQIPRLLVVVPSNALRTQIANKFISLGFLPEAGVVPLACPKPSVAIFDKRLDTTEAALVLRENANVIVASASIMAISDEAAVEVLCSCSTHLFVDEAHHVGAKTWIDIRAKFDSKPIIQFTATPFRKDGKPLGGRVIFNYPMGDAQRAGYFRSIRLEPIEEYFSDEADQKIAERAVELLRSDLAHGRDHLLLARVQSKSKAEQLFGLYLKIAPDLRPVVLHSALSGRTQRERIAALEARDSRIIICVNMLGEGYDLPNLKIAAIHDNHKSLAVTLQFLGRFTRSATDQSLGNASVVMNIADPEVAEGLHLLYSQDADWDVLLRRLSESRIEKEIRLQEVVDSLRGDGDLHKQISLWNLTPAFSTQFYETQCQDWSPRAFEDLLPKFVSHWHAISHEKRLLVVVGIESQRVKWGNYQELTDRNYKLLMLHWDEDAHAMFVGSNDFNAFPVGKIVQAVTGDQCSLFAGNKIFNVLNGIEYPLVRNLGASQSGAISFTQYFGPNVKEGLTLIEEASGMPSNIAVLGYEDGERVIWGCSQKKAKVWSPQKKGTVHEWMVWSKTVWSKMAVGDVDLDNVTRDLLRPIPLAQMPDAYPVSCQWGEYLLASFEGRTSIWFGETEVPFYFVDLMITRDGERDAFLIEVSSETDKAVYALIIGGAKKFEYSLVEGKPLQIQRGKRDRLEFEDYMEKDPVVINYLDGSFTYNHFQVKIPDNVGEYSRDLLTSHSWAGVDITKESMGKRRNSNTVQHCWYENIEAEFDIIINDDGKGEAADLIAFKILDDKILMNLVHCKFSGSLQPGARVDDFYAVCGQAQKSIRWKHLGMSRLYQHIKRREETWLESGFSRFLKGDIKQLASLKNRARTTPIELHVSIIQPGLKTAQVSDDILRLLGTTEVFLKKTAQASLDVVGSA